VGGRLRTLTGLLATALAASAAAVPWGVNAHVPSPEMLDLARDAGIRWVRIDFVWAWVEPEPDRFDWSVYDAVAAAAAARGLEVYATLIHTPAWATSGEGGTGAPDNPGDWADVCYRAAERYRGRIDHWGMWNEPNSTRFWTGTRGEYIEAILRNGSRAVHAANPDAKVCGPDLGHLQSGDWDDWLDDVLEQASDSLDVVTHHLYPDGGANSIVDALEDGGDYPWDPPSVKSILKRRGWLGRPFWLTETGYDSGTTTEGEQRQALFMTQLADVLYGRYRTLDWVDRVFVYELLDDSRYASRWGLVAPAPEYRLKLAYGGLRDAVARLPVDDAAIVRASLPETLRPGEQATATIRLRNTGTTTWSAAAGYRLSALGGSDPFAAPVHELPEGLPVAPSGEVELAIAFYAGTATTPPEGLATTWTMSRDGLPFGDQVRRTVRVSDAPARWRWIVPAAANSDGVNRTSWHTDLVLHNPTADPLTVGIAALEQGRRNDLPRATRVTVPAGASTLLRDAVASLFGLRATVALRVEADRHELRISSRTANRLAQGSRGEFVPAPALADLAPAGAELRLISLARSADPAAGSRANLGLVNPSDAPSLVDVTFRDAGGEVLGALVLDLPGWGYRQITDVLAGFVPGDVRDVVAVVRSRDGATPIAYTAAVDNRSGDPSILLAEPPREPPLVIPAAAHVTGVADSRWRSDLHLHNAGDAPGSVRVELLGRTGPAADTAALAAGGSEQVEDVLATLFATQGVAPLRLSWSGTRTVAGSRTYAVDAAGSAGQAVPALAETAAAAGDDTVRLLQLAHSADPARGFRTNLGFVNLADTEVTLKVELYRSPSQRVGVVYYSVPAAGSAQANSVFARWTVTDVDDGWAVVRPITPGARFIAWASVIDNPTGDPSFQVGQRD